VEIALSVFETEDATLKGDYLWQVVEIVIGGIPTILELHFMCLFMALSRVLLPGSISSNLFDQKRRYMYLRKVEVGI